MPELSVTGRSVNYLDIGTGSPPVVLLHAFPLSSQMWAPQIACLAAGHRVVTPDLAGFGDTEPLADVTATTMASMADDVVGLVESLGAGPVVLGGLSMGGYVAFDLVRRRPDLVAALVLADTRPGADSPEVAQRRSDQQRMVRAGGRDSVIDTLLGGLVGDSTRAGRPELVGLVRMMMAEQSDDAVIGALEAMKHRPDSTPLLEGIAVPTLAVVGAEDTLTTPETVAGWQSMIPGSTLLELPGAGHLSNLEAPDAFNAALVDLVDGLPPSG